MSTPKFELPETCSVCNANKIEWNMSDTYGCVIEYAKYKCHARSHKYVRHSHFSVDEECSQSPKNLKIAERNRDIDTKVAKVLKEFKLTDKEWDDFVIRSERGRWDKTVATIYKYR